MQNISQILSSPHHQESTILAYNTQNRINKLFAASRLGKRTILPFVRVYWPSSSSPLSFPLPLPSSLSTTAQVRTVRVPTAHLLWQWPQVARIGSRNTSPVAAMAGLMREASMQLVAGHGRAAMVGSSTSPAHSGRCLCGREFARIQEINITNSSKQ